MFYEDLAGACAAISIVNWCAMESMKWSGILRVPDTLYTARMICMSTPSLKCLPNYLFDALITHLLLTADRAYT